MWHGWQATGIDARFCNRTCNGGRSEYMYIIGQLNMPCDQGRTNDRPGMDEATLSKLGAWPQCHGRDEARVTTYGDAFEQHTVWPYDDTGADRDPVAEHTARGNLSRRIDSYILA